MSIFMRMTSMSKVINRLSHKRHNLAYRRSCDENVFVVK